MAPLKKSFLLADDDIDDVKIFHQVLASIDRSIEFHNVENGKYMLEFLSHSENIPDIVFLDINMPVLNGWQSLKRLKETPSLRNIPAVIYSTSSAKRDVDIAFDLGATLFFTKPEDVKELSAVLETIATVPEDLWADKLTGFTSVKIR